MNSFLRKFFHPVKTKLLIKSINDNFINFALEQTNTQQQKNALALVVSIAEEEELPDYLQKLKKSTCTYEDVEYWIKITDRKYIEELDFKLDHLRGIPYNLLKRDIKNIHILKKHNINFEGKKTIYPHIIFSSIAYNDFLVSDILNLIRQHDFDLKYENKSQLNIMDTIGFYFKEDYLELIEEIRKKEDLKPNFNFDFYAKILSFGNPMLERLKQYGLDYKAVLGKQEISKVALENINQDNNKDIIEFLKCNKHNIDLDFELRQKIALIQPETLRYIIENKEEYDLEKEHFEDLYFYLQYTGKTENTNNLYEQNTAISIDIIKSFLENILINKNIKHPNKKERVKSL